MNKKIKKLLFFTLSLLLFSFANPIIAQEEATSAATEELKISNLKKIIQKAANNPNVQKVLGELSQQKRGFIGQVDRVTEESLTITNNKGTEIIPFDDQVTLLKANQKISIDDVAVGDWLVVMGLIIDDAFVPKRILVSSLSLRPKNHVVTLGTIIVQSSKEITILSRQNEEVNFNINPKTQYQDQNGEVARGSEFSEDIQVLVIGDEDDDGKNASIIRSLVSLEALQDDE